MINMKQARKTAQIPLYQHTLYIFFFLFILLHFHKTLFHKDMQGYLLNYHYLIYLSYVFVMNIIIYCSG